MATETPDKILEEKRNVTSKISDTCRVVGFGLLAIFYSIKIGGGDAAAIETSHPKLVWAIGFLGFLAILFDYLQYFFGARSVSEALASADKRYDSKSFAYRARGFFFNAKQIAVFFGVIALGLLFLQI